MDSRQRADLDRYITGNYGEDQFRDEPDEDACPECGGDGFVTVMESAMEHHASCVGDCRANLCPVEVAVPVMQSCPSCGGGLTS